MKKTRVSVRDIQWEPLPSSNKPISTETEQNGTTTPPPSDPNGNFEEGHDEQQNIAKMEPDGNTIAIAHNKTTIYLGAGLRRSYQIKRISPHKSHLFGTPKPPNLDSTTNAELRNGEMVQSSSPVGLRSGPLPSNWEIAYTELGEKYFIDHNSGTTQWQDPREQQSPLNKRSSTAEFPSHQTNGVSNGHNDVDEQELPEGWERIEDETHGVFYVDHINKRTQYEKPELPNKSEAPLRNGYTSTGITTSTARQHHHQRAESSQRLPPEPSYPPPIYHSTTPTTANHFEQPSPSMWRNGVSPSVKRRSQQQMQHQFTTDPSQLKGQLLTTRLYKGPTGFGFTLIGNDGGNAAPEFIQIKSILPGGPAALDNLLHPGDVLVFVDNECILGSSQDEACGLLRSIPPGEPVTLQVCRGYPLVLDPTNKIISLGNMYTPHQHPSKWHDQHDILITKGPNGFGFTITDSPQGQRVKSILYPDQCPNLFENDLILEVDGKNALPLSHAQLVQMMQDLPVGYQTYLLISRSSPKNRSRTPTAGFKFGEKNRTTPLPVLPRSKTPAPQTRAFRPQSFGNTTVPRNYGTSRQNNIYEELNRVRLNSDSYVHQPHYGVPAATPNYVPLSSLAGRHSAVPVLFANDPKYQLVTVNLLRKIDGFGFGFRLVGGSEMDAPLQWTGRHDVAVQMIKQAAAIGHVKLVVRRLKDNWSNGYNNYTSTFTGYPANHIQNSHTYDVHLVKSPNEDFGCTLVTIEHRFIGRIIPGTPAERCGRLRAGDCVAMINGFTTTHMTHRQVIDYIKSCGNQVTFTIDPTITMPRYAHPPPVNGTVNGPIEAEDAVYTTSNPYGTLTNGHNNHNGHNGHYQSNGNIAMGSGLDYLNQDDKDYKLINVELSRGIKNFGFSIRGGFEFGRMPLFILRIAGDGPAAQEGSLRVGDQLMSINGQETPGMTHERAINLIREQSTVRLVVKRKLLTP
ncbi:hypothetical protein M3Y97_00710600 [Aphelenchoides bicaudatus]|nr:hypothetical protein M3Y97_00710600 [Aphelenchoides bicaudatus]